MIEKEEWKPENLRKLELEQLEKIRLITEILEKKQPIWKKTSFIGVVGSLLLTFLATIVSIWQIQSSRIETLKKEKEELQSKTEQIQKREDEAHIRYNEAIAEKAIVQSEKAEAISEKNVTEQKISNWELSKREEDLKASVRRLKKLNNELARKSKKYKYDFIEAYIEKNNTVRADIIKYSSEQNRQEFQTWLKERFLWTALTRYEQYILEEVENASEE